MIIKKSPEEKLNDIIGKFFRLINIIEYKSPDDSLTIDDFFKVQAYGLLYKVIDHKVDEIPITDITITLIRHTYPREMIKALKKYNFAVTEIKSGVYIIETGNFIPVQLMVTSQMSKEDFEALPLLSKSVSKDDLKNFIEKIADSKDSNIIENARAFLRICLEVNKNAAEEIKKEKAEMKDVIREVFGDWFEEDKEQAVKIAVKQAVKIAIEETAKATAEATAKAINEENNKRVAADMLKDSYPLNAIIKISRLPEVSIRNLAAKLGVNVVV